METKADVASAAAAPPAAAPDTLPSSSSDEDEGPSLSEFDPYDYSDIAERFYAYEIEEIPFFEDMTASQRRCNQSYREQSYREAEPRPSATVLAQTVTVDPGRPSITVPVDDIIQRLLAARKGRLALLSKSEIRYLCRTAQDVFLSQPMLLELEAPISICGDIHGQYTDLLELFVYGGFPPQANYLFLGNYVNMGKQSIETICLLLAYKIKYPENFFLLRGNHESAIQTRAYGFFDECKRRFNVRLWKAFVDCFNCFPIAAIIDDKIFCVHSGLSPDLSNLDQIRKIRRPTDVPDSGLLCDLLWSGPSKEFQRWGLNHNEGASHKFGAEVIEDFLQKNDLDLICRGNQVVQDGYEFFANKQLVTIFSAPLFQGEYDNASAVMSVDETLMCSFHILRVCLDKAFR